jgi:hypothetical protein
VQAGLVADLRLVRLLWLVIATIHPDHDGGSIKSFTSNLKSKGWIVLSEDVYFPDLGDTIAGQCHVLTAVHSSCASATEAFALKRPPPLPPRPLGEFIWEPFNRQEHAISLARDDGAFPKQETGMQASTPPIQSNDTARVLVRYHLHRPNANTLVTIGSEVVSIDGLCPVFNACPTNNIFQHYFGIEFHHSNHTYVCAISSYEFVHCFGFIDQLTYCLSHPTYLYAMDAAMPGRTLAWLFEQGHSHLLYIRDTNSEIFLPNQFAALAATIQVFVNGAIGMRLPSCKQ